MKYLLYSLVKSRRFGILLFIVAFMWMITLLNMSLISDPIQRTESMKVKMKNVVSFHEYSVDI
jgi:hypothetical protein